MTKKPRVQRISTLVSQLMSRRGYAQMVAGEDFLSTVGTAVGVQLGEAITIGKLKSGVLQIFAADSVTLQELNFQKRAILKQIQNDLPLSKVTDVRFRILTQ